MISPISFGSTYKVKSSSKDNAYHQIGYSKIPLFCDQIGVKYSEDIKLTDNHRPSHYLANATIVAPDNKDADIEIFFANYGVRYKKYDTKELISPKSVERRIKEAPKGYRTVKVNVDKLNELLENQKDSNFEHCKSDYDKHFKKTTDFMIKSGDEIVAPTLYIIPWGSKDEAVDYIKTFGADKLNDDSVAFLLSQRTSSPDHCMFFAMQDAGMKDIPVYVDKDTYEIGKALDIFKPILQL